MNEQTSHFTQLLSRLLTNSERQAFIELLLTPKEIEEIEQRIAILSKISKNEAQRDISSSLKVGIATVTRGSKAWNSLREDEQNLFYQLLHKIS